MTSTQAQWVKVVYEESNGKTSVKQGFLAEEENFIRIVGDQTEALIRRDKIISVTNKRVKNHDQRN